MEWLFPGAVYAAAAEVAVASAAVSSEQDRTSSSSPTFSVKAAESGSSVSSPSSSSSSGDDRPRFSPSRTQSPLLCFGAGGAGRLLWGGARARAPAKQQEEEAAAASMAPPKADPVGRYLRRISRRLRRARSGGKVSPSPRGAAAAVDDTARERAESVARAIAHCRDTLRRGAPASTPSLDDWLHDGQEEITASAAANCKRRGSRPTTPSHPRRAGWSLEVQAMGDQRKEPPCRALPSRDSSVTASAVVRGKEPPPHHDRAAGDEMELETFGSFDEMEFLKIFDGDDEVINHYFFISVQV